MAKRPSKSYRDTMYGLGIPSMDTLPVTYYDTPVIDAESIPTEATAKEIIEMALPGFFSKEEEVKGTESSRQMIRGEDGKLAMFDVVKDIKTGEIVDQQPSEDIYGITISEDAESESEALQGEYAKDQLYKEIYTVLDEDGNIRKDIGKSFLGSAFDNSLTYQGVRLVNRVFGEDWYGRYGSNVDPMINMIDFRADGVYSGDVKMPLSPEEQQMVSDFVGEKTSYDADNFASAFANVALQFAIDMPLFVRAGKLGGKLIQTAKPGLGMATTTVGSIPSRLANNFAMLSIAGAPGTINRTMDDGIKALQDDIFHTAMFAGMASAFGIGGSLGSRGFSSLLRKPRMLRTSEAANFLRRNPAVYDKLIGAGAGFGLGYTVGGGETAQDKLALGMTFAAMHFAHKGAFSNFMKGKQKGIMVEKDGFETMKAGMEKGAPFEEAVKVVGSGGLAGQRYYEKDGNKLYRIDEGRFANKGEVVRLEEVPIEYSKEVAPNYKYITEAVPFYRKTLSEAMKQGKLQQVIAEVHKKISGKIKNPYKYTKRKKGEYEGDLLSAKSKEELEQNKLYEEFEYGRNLTSKAIGSIIFTEKLNKLFKVGQLPDKTELADAITETSNKWKIPYTDVEKWAIDNLPDYFQNPEAFIKKQMTGRLVQDLVKSMEIGSTALIEAINREALQESGKLGKPIKLGKGKGKISDEVWYDGLGKDKAVPARKVGEGEFEIGTRDGMKVEVKADMKKPPTERVIKTKAEIEEADKMVNEAMDADDAVVNKAIKAEAKKQATAKAKAEKVEVSEEDAFVDKVRKMDKSGIEVLEKVKVKGTEEVVEVKKDASDALKTVEKRLSNYKKLLDCI